MATLDVTPTEGPFPKTSEQSQQVAVATEGNFSGANQLSPAGQVGMSRVQDADNTDDIEDVRDNDVTPPDVTVAAEQTLADGIANPGGRDAIRNTSESLHDGRY